jgi:SPP1 gp7 family putative phage head morphogenesis protein
LDPKTRSAIERALEELRRDLISLLQEGAAKSYLLGNLMAYMSLGLRPEDAAAGGDDAERAGIAYAQRYRDLLVNEGASIIGGKKVPWLSDMSAEQRAKIYDIIDQGLKDGKATGIKETGIGTYPKDSIAAELQEYFGQRKSHASMVARTETGRILNVGSLERFIAAGVKRVKVFDDEGPNSCDACIRANGQEWSIEDAMMNELEHPNCVRAFGPIVEY